MRKKYYYADFETTQPRGEHPRVSVYLWAIVSGNYKTWGRTIEEFVEWCRGESNSVLFFHNLRFDFSYIHYFLILHKIPYQLLEKSGVIYSVKFFGVELRDSLNFLPMTLAEVGKNYCTKYQKTSIDYNVYEGHVATREEIDYCINDCKVLEEGLTNYLTALELVLDEAGAPESAKKVWKKLTNAGVAFEAFRELSEYDHCCPKTTVNEYRLYSQAYRGGYVYSRPTGVIDDILMIDCNSMYPYMYSTIDMPIGKGIPCKDWEDLARFKFGIVKVLIEYELRDGYIPIIGGGVGKYGNNLYKSDSNGEYEELVVSTTDLELIREFYDCDVVYQWGVGFETVPEFFKRYADTFISVKNKEKGAKRNVAKVLLNSPYGKTAMNGLNEIKEYTIEDDGVVGHIMGYELDESAYQYLPIAVAITAAARKYLLSTAAKIGFERVYYMDTDSIKFKRCETGIEYDPNRLGAWKNEGLCAKFKTIAPKKYVYWGVTYPDGTVDKTLHYACAGFAKKTLERDMAMGKECDEAEAMEYINKFAPSLTLECLQSKIVEGGRALIPVQKMMK